MAFSSQKRIFSGIQATGTLHLGNYLGALRPWVGLQKNYSCLYCIVDMHALTANPAPEALRHSTYITAATYLAAGIDPKEHIVFNQSRVFQHAELAWILNCIARFGWMNRMTQFKDKAGKNSAAVSLGLFAYPSLMAADILLYKATAVPVGADQKQHIELTRDIAQKFNLDYAASIAKIAAQHNTKTQSEQNGFFPLPEALIGETSARVMSLRDGRKKMSKSDASDFSRIHLTDDADQIAQKIKKAKTDAFPLPNDASELVQRPEAENLIAIYAALCHKTKQEAVEEFAGKDFSSLKNVLTEVVIAEILPISKKIKELTAFPDYIEQVLHDGAERASHLAEETMQQVREIVGYLTHKYPK